MTALDRRAVLKLLASAPAAAALSWTHDEAVRAHEGALLARQAAQQAGTAYAPKFFTASEWATVGMLVDYIIPRDEKSGSATEAGVPEFMDFMMVDQPNRQNAMRAGLAWFDAQAVARTQKRFVEASDAERRALLDEISWPRRAKPEMAAGVTFFNSFRDLTASGFFTSEIGMADLEFMGNVFVREFKGCPEPWLKKLGLVVLACVWIAGATTVGAGGFQQTSPAVPPPPPPAIDGARLYTKHCQPCHGKNGVSTEPAMGFTARTWKQGSSSAAIAKVIAEGVPTTEMKAFKELLTEPEIAAVAKLVRSFDPRLPPEKSGGGQ